MARGGGMKTAPCPPGLGKAPLGVGLRHSAKRDRKSITLHVKLEVLRRFEEGEKLTQIARALGLATSTVASIRVNKDKIRANSQAAAPVSATQLTRCRGVLMGHMERLLSLWIEEQKRQNLPVSTLLIQDKARRLFAQLQHEQGSGVPTETFGASNGWFARFKSRHNVLLTDEPAVADAQAAACYPPLRRSIVVLASHAGLGGVAETDFTPLLQAHGEPLPRSIPQDVEDGDVSGPGLPWEAGKCLASRRAESDLTEATVGVGTEEAGVGALSPEHLAQALSHFAAGLRVLVENDPNRERSLRVSRGVHCALTRLRELHREKRRQARAAASSSGPIVTTRELAGSLYSPQAGPTKGGQVAKGTNPEGQTSLAVLCDLGLGPDLR
ncbi:hypothetical protein CB1_000053013 [Camelus ferus]|nr:hypothetical protein CB1_000053013 [Camelus ferus]